jgi:hypothetical protein
MGGLSLTREAANVIVAASHDCLRSGGMSYPWTNAEGQMARGPRERQDQGSG